MTCRNSLNISLAGFELLAFYITALIRSEHLLMTLPFVVVLRFLYDFKIDLADVAFSPLVDYAIKVDVQLSLGHM